MPSAHPATTEVMIDTMPSRSEYLKESAMILLTE